MDEQAVIHRIQSDARLGRIKVPSMPDIALRVRSAVSDPRVNNAAVAKIVQMDPVLAARLIQIANSSMYRGKSPIKDCLSAVTRLGLGVTRNFVLSFSMRHLCSMRSAAAKQRMTGIWRHSCEVAALSFVLAGTENALQPDRAMLAGLLHDIGVLPLMYYLTDYPEMIRDDALFNSLVMRLRVQLGVFLLRMWNFDDQLIEVVQQAENVERNNDQPPDYTDVVIVAHHLADSLTQDTELYNTSNQVQCMAKFGVTQLGPHACMEVLDNARDEIEAMIHLLV